jgi:hypothetical protein
MTNQGYLEDEEQRRTPAPGMGSLNIPQQAMGGAQPRPVAPGQRGPVSQPTMQQNRQERRRYYGEA